MADKTPQVWQDVLPVLRNFRDERDWVQFHTPKDLACAISVEAGELLNTFRWSGGDTSVEGREQAVKEELADVMIYCLYLVDAIDADPIELIANKISLNQEHYPVKKAQGNARKYTKL